jgi:hypothetical protein
MISADPLAELPFRRSPPFSRCPGEDFLGEFDMLIDNAHNLLCLDGSSAMAAGVKGPHIALMAPARTTNSMPALRSLIIAATLSDATRSPKA